MEVNRINVQLDRLQRSYFSARREHNLADFYDLVHMLRFWIEMANDKNSLGEMYDNRVFRVGTPNKKLLRELRDKNAEYIFVYMAFHNHGEIITHSMFMPEEVKTMFRSDKIVVFGRIASSDPKVMPGIKDYYLGSDHSHYKNSVELRPNRLNLTQFLNSPVVTLRFNSEPIRYTPLQIIKRAANELLDASHYQESLNKVVSESIADLLPMLKVCLVGNIKLLYFLMLYFAQEILIAFGRIERVKFR